jgi:hypothetical protein
MLENLQEVIDYLNENMSDPVPQYILKKEILANPSYELEIKQLKESKWYNQLSAEQWVNGSWGRFHTQDTKSSLKHKFKTTESALRRAHELSLEKNDEVIFKAIQLMERYIKGQEEWLDINEHFYGFKVAFKTLITANLSIFDPKHPLVQTKKEICANNLSKAFIHGSIDEAIWENENKKSNEILLKPYTVYVTWLLQNNDFLDETMERNFLEYIWYRKEGIYYRTNSPSSNIEVLESKNFLTWLSGLESLSDFSLFSEFMSMKVSNHLLNEIRRLMYKDVSLPNTNPIFDHYTETWSKKNNRKNDLMLRILRLLVKC